MGQWMDDNKQDLRSLWDNTRLVANFMPGPIGLGAGIADLATDVYDYSTGDASIVAPAISALSLPFSLLGMGAIDDAVKGVKSAKSGSIASKYAKTLEEQGKRSIDALKKDELAAKLKMQDMAAEFDRKGASILGIGKAVGPDVTKLKMAMVDAYTQRKASEYMKSVGKAPPDNILKSFQAEAASAVDKWYETTLSRAANYRQLKQLPQEQMVSRPALGGDDVFKPEDVQIALFETGKANMMPESQIYNKLWSVNPASEISQINNTVGQAYTDAERLRRMTKDSFKGAASKYGTGLVGGGVREVGDELDEDYMKNKKK